MSYIYFVFVWLSCSFLLRVLSAMSHCIGRSSPPANSLHRPCTPAPSSHSSPPTPPIVDVARAFLPLSLDTLQLSSSALALPPLVSPSKPQVLSSTFMSGEEAAKGTPPDCSSSAGKSSTCPCQCDHGKSWRRRNYLHCVKET